MEALWDDERFGGWPMWELKKDEGRELEAAE